MIKKHAVIYSVLIHILLVIIIFLFKLDDQQERMDRDIYLDYTFIEKPEIVHEDNSPKIPAAVTKNIPLPPVELPHENPPDVTSAAIIPDTSFTSIQSLAFMPSDSLTAMDSLLLVDPNLLALRTVFMQGIRNEMPEDTTKKWKQITPVSMTEYLKMLKYSDGFNNAQMQEKYNTGGIKIPLDAIFDLFK